MSKPHLLGSKGGRLMMSAAVRENLRGLVEQAPAYSGAADDELISRRIAEQ
jgi:hypothetical protein